MLPLQANSPARERPRRPSAPSGQYRLAIEVATPATRKPRNAQEYRGRTRTPIWSLSSPVVAPRSNQQHKAALLRGKRVAFSDVDADARLVATPDRPERDQ